MKKVNRITIPLCLALLLSGQPFAATSDRDQPIQVEADGLEIRENENISVYTGNVRLEQGSLLIQADRMIIHFNDDGELQLIEMDGDPARFRQTSDAKKEMLGEARHLEYHEAESLLVLDGDARFSSNGDTIESASIRINTDTNLIEAGSTGPDERVRMVIQPRQNP